MLSNILCNSLLFVQTKLQKRANDFLFFEVLKFFFYLLIIFSEDWQKRRTTWLKNFRQIF